MGIDLSAAVVLPNTNFWGRDVYFTPVASQGVGVVAYLARGIFTSGEFNVPLDDGTVLSDQKTILDIRGREFAVLPIQGDLVNIPADGDVEAAGDFQIVDVSDDGGGEVTLTLQKIQKAP